MLRRIISCLCTWLSACVLLVVSLAVIEFGLRLVNLFSPRSEKEGEAQLPLVGSSPVLYRELVPGKVEYRLVRHLATPSPPKSSEQPRHQAAGKTVQYECQRIVRKVRFRVNRWGLRGADVVVPKPDHTYRILCLGNDNLVAPEHEETELAVHWLQQTLQASSRLDIEVLNAGMPSGCPLQWYLAYTRRWRSLQVDLILIHLQYRDLLLDEMVREALATKVTNLSQTDGPSSSGAYSWRSLWARTRHELLLVDKTLCLLSKLWEHSALSFQVREECLWSDYWRWHKTTRIRLAWQPLEQLASLCHRQGIGLIVWCTPEPWCLSETACALGDARLRHGMLPHAKADAAQVMNYLLEACAERRIPALSALSVFPMGEKIHAWFYADEPRWTASAHKAVGQFLAEQLLLGWPGPWHPEYHTQNRIYNQMDVRRSSDPVPYLDQ